MLAPHLEGDLVVVAGRVGELDELAALLPAFREIVENVAHGWLALGLES